MDNYEDCLLLFPFIFTDALEVTEDANFQLLSTLLAKVQQLEAKNMIMPNIRNTRQTTDKPTKAPVIADNKQCNCPPSVVTYIRWGILLVLMEQIPSTLE